jgi:hypothetical protein
MKETTKPNTSHLMKRDLAVNIAVLPLPTPPAGARGEGWGSAAPKFETRNSNTETSSNTEIQETSNPDSESGFRTLNIELRFGIGTSRTQHRTPIRNRDFADSASNFELGKIAGTGRVMVNLQFPQFADIAARRDEPLPLSTINEQILTLTTDYRLPDV